MKNKTKAILLFLAIIAVFAAVYFVFIYPYTPTYNWKATLYNNDENPYGAKYIYELLDESSDPGKFVLIDDSVATQLNANDTGSVYIFIGLRSYLDTIGTARLVDFVNNGNQIFFSVEDPSSDDNTTYEIMELFEGLGNVCVKYYNDTGIQMTFMDDTMGQPFSFNYRYKAEDRIYTWQYFDSCFQTYDQETLEMTTLGRINEGHINMFAFNYGKGKVYFHASPIMFSNYYMIEDEGFRFANATLKQFKGKKIYWDEASKHNEAHILPPKPNESFLKYVFSQPGLKWGWYLLLAGVVLFIAFRSKRRQGVIPLLPENKNTSAEFVKSVAMLYLSSGNHSKIAGEMMRHFLSFIKMKYGINVKMNKTDEYVPGLAVVSAIDSTVLRSIFKLNIQLEVGNESENQRLKELNNHLENFYKNCK